MTRRLLVGTSRFLLLVDIASGEQRILSRKYGLYYGITWDENYYYIAGRSHLRFWPTSKYERPRLLVLNPDLSLSKLIRIPVTAGALHQILYHGGRLYCSCSRDDSYVIREKDDWSIWYPSKDAEHHGKDTHHFNSIWFEGDRMFLVGHNRGPSDIWELESGRRDLLKKYRVGRYIHNVWREDGELLVCNSGEGCIETASGKVVCKTGGFPRGVVIGPDLNVVGISGIAGRANRLHTKGVIQLYDKNWQLKDTIDLGLCGQVCEIRSLDGEDVAHNGLVAPQ